MITVVVMSDQAGEGKTVVAQAIANTLRVTGFKVELELPPGDEVRTRSRHHDAMMRIKETVPVKIVERRRGGR